MLKEGTKAPDFSLPDQNGQTHSLSDYIGRYVLVYFYPKDDTPGCTKEACVIRDSYKLFEEDNTKVMGISADSVASHKAFADKYSLPFTLLSDKKRVAIKHYEAASTPLTTARVSYLINPEGMIAKAYNKVDPSHHGEQILNDLWSLKNPAGKTS